MFVLLLIFTVAGERMMSPVEYFPTLESCVRVALGMKEIASALVRDNGWDSAVFGCARLKAGKDEV